MSAQARLILSETDIVAETPPAAVPAPMPPEARLAMPAQSLFHFDPKKDRARLPSRSGIVTLLARVLVFGGGFGLTAYGANQMYEVVAVGSVTFLKWALVCLFVANFSWIALAFTSACVGFLWLLFAPPNRPRFPAS